MCLLRGMYGCMPKRSNNNTTNGVNLMINHSFLINVKELMHQLLPRPQYKLDSDRAESLDELPIIKIRCDLNAIEGLYNKF